MRLKECIPLIRLANSDDVERLSAIARAAYRSYVPRIGREPAPMIADFASLVDQAKVWVLDQSRVDGFIVIYPMGDGLQVENVAVDPFAQGNGFGRQLLEFAETEAKRLGITELTLYTNAHMTENLSLYPSFGYREIGRRREDGFDRVYFSKTLSPKGQTKRCSIA